jgi:hypothetical protein
MNKITTDLGITKGPLAFTFEESGGEPIITTLPLDGVLVVRAGITSCFTLANGSVLKGVRWLTADDTPLADELGGPWQMPLIVVEAEPGGYAVCMPESLDVTEPQERLYVVGGLPVHLSENSFQIFMHRYDLGAGPVWRTKISNWTPDASSTTYTPSNPGDFSGAPPTTQQEFNDRAAAALASLLGGPIP